MRITTVLLVPVVAILAVHDGERMSRVAALEEQGRSMAAELETHRRWLGEHIRLINALDHAQNAVRCWAL
jgi:hypothetical protein